MGVKEKERNQEKVTGELMETEKEWAKEGIQQEGTRKSCVLTGNFMEEKKMQPEPEDRDRGRAQQSSLGAELARQDW